MKASTSNSGANASDFSSPDTGYRASQNTCTFFQQLSVSSKDENPIYSNSLKNGVQYKLTSTGKYRYWWPAQPTAEADAECAETTEKSKLDPDFKSGWNKENPEDLFDLRVNGQDIDWGGCSSTNTYTYTMIGNGNPVSFMVKDDYYPDNEGSLTVRIEECVTGDTVSAPTFNPAPGTYTSPVDVTLSSATSGARIHYTTDGSTPTDSSPIYSSAIHLTSTTTIKARAFKSGWTTSTIIAGRYTITGTVSTPTFSPDPGTYAPPVDVSLSSATDSAVIRYTTDGSTPTELSHGYSSPMRVETTVTIKARAYLSGWTPSEVATSTYTIDPTSVDPIIDGIPNQYILFQNYPNPFNPETQIRFGLPEPNFVELRIYNMRGNEIRILVKDKKAAGMNTVAWDGKDSRGNQVASGVYIYQIRTNEFVDSKKLILMR